MKTINYEAFNKGFFVKVNHSKKWEKGEFELFDAFLSSNDKLSAEFKNQLPQFAFNVDEGDGAISIGYPIVFIVTEIDLPKAFKEKAKMDVALAKYWKGQFRSWYRKIRRSENIPYWMMYITSSGYGFRFVLQTDKPIKNETEYKIACAQFLKLLEPYGIGKEYHDKRTINRGWYFPTNRRYFDVRGDVFVPNLDNLKVEERPPTKSDEKETIGANSTTDLEKVISQIEQQRIDITADYHDWISIGFALSYAYKEDGRSSFHRISKFYHGYNQSKCDNQYDACLRSKGSGITLGTLFFIARNNGIQIPSGSRARDERFWYVTDRGLKIDYDAYFKILHSNGIGRLVTDHSDDIVFIEVNRSKKLVKQINKFEISDFSTQLIENLNVDEVLKKKVKNAFLEDSKILMPKNYAAINKINIDFVVEDAETMYFYFTNCFVRITKKEITTHLYDELKGYIWESQIIPREFRFALAKEIKKKSEFYTFIKDVSRDMNHDEDRKRFISLKTTIGYLLHRYKDPAVPKSIVFMDASLRKDTKGRTGKGIVKTGLSKMRKLANENGKQFEMQSRFSLSQVTIDTDILFIDDVTNRFDFEKLYSVLTEGFVVERKHKDKFHMSYEDSPKILITTNYAIHGSGDSFEGRIYEYEFSDYYKHGHSPMDKFGHLLFNQWDQEQWNLFDNFMIRCCKTYLRIGLKESQFINLHLKKIITKTGFAFVDYLSANIEIGKKYKKQSVYEDFIKENPSYKDWGRNKFTIHMKEYYKLKKMEVKESHSGTTHYFMVVYTNSDLS